MPGTHSVSPFCLRHTESGTYAAHARRKHTEAVGHVSNYIKADPTIYHNISYFIEGWGWDHTKWTAVQWPTAVGSVSDPRELVNLTTSDTGGNGK